jgi:hypothetical protein
MFTGHYALFEAPYLLPENKGFAVSLNGMFFLENKTS